MLMILGAFLLVALGFRGGFVLLALGLILDAGVLLFLWKALGLFACRCSELEQGRAELMDRVNLLRAALDAAGDGILVVDEAGQARAWNRPFLDLWGLSETALAAVGDLLAADHLLAQVKDTDGWQAGVTAFLAAEGASRDSVELWDGRVFERHARSLDGALRLWRFRDVTAQATADFFVRRLAQAVEQIPVSLVITDTAGTLEFVNSKFSELTGYGLEEALGQNPRLLKSGLMPAGIYEDLWGTITAGRAWAGELQNRKKDGELFWERATISPLRDRDGVITHYLGLKEDITHQKKLEQQLRHAQKLEAVGLLAGGVAHDFNNILQVINGYGTLMQMAQAPSDPHCHSLSEMLKAAERAAQLTHSLLAFSRKQVMNPKVVNLNAVVGNVEKLLRRVLGEDIHLAVTPLDASLQVHVDLGQIDQVLLNLAANARDAMPKGGSLTITTERFLLDEQFVEDRHFGRPGAYALLVVKDSGEGMDEPTLKRIFDPFFSTREMGRGTGLGLATVYGIIKQHNGYILAESTLGAGSSFKVYLPIASQSPSAMQEPALQESRIRGTETLLVVEDEPAVRGLVEIVLRKYGYSVLLAGDGQEAVDRFREHGQGIDMILMDIIMPRKSGRQAYDEISRERPGMKVLFTSGYTADFIKSRGELGQGMELLMKPVQPLALVRKVREILDRPEK